MSSSSFTKIYTVREIIDMAFGSASKNTVNFKLIQTVLYLLARNLRILERRVEVNMGSFIDLPASTLSVTEIKVHARVSKEETNALPGPSKKHAKEKAAIDKKSKEDKTPGKTSAPETSSKKSSYEHVGPKKGEKSRKEVTKKVSDEKISPQLSAKVSMEKITLGKASKKKPTEKIAPSKKDEKENVGSTERSTSVSSELRKSNKYLMERHHTQSLLEMIEQNREKELRIIHQRADSNVETVKTPTPMASLDSAAEIQFEKLLLVENLPSRDADKRISLELDVQEKAKKLSLVTVEQFKALVNKVAALQEILDPLASPFLPENAQIMQGLRKGASLTEGMAMLQFSSRIDALESTIGRMTSILAELITRKSGTNPAESTLMPEEETKTKFGKDLVVLHMGAATSGLTTTEGTDHDAEERSAVSVEMPVTQPQQEEVNVQEWEMTRKDSYKYVTYEQFEHSLQEMYDNFFKAVSTSTARSNENAKNAVLLAHNLEDAIDTSLGMGGRLTQLEDTIDDYAAQINNLDTGLSSQMAQYQEQLSQMQHDLESGLESMAEALANQGGETEAMTELTKHFAAFQADIDLSLSMNRDLQELQELMGLDLECIRKEMEVFCEIKCDRDEVVDALKDKAGIKDLNGLVYIDQFEAVRGVIEKNILKSYAKFNNQELVWQRAIDELSKEIQQRADIQQVEGLAKDIQKNCNMLKARIDGIQEVLGEPKAVALTRRVFRDSACLSCSSPAYMDMEEPGMVPMLPSVRLPLIGAEAPPRPKEDGDHRVCYPGLPIPHARDSRANICSRYCGGVHTRQSAHYPRVSPSLGVQHAHNPAFDLGSDGKSYMVEQDIIRKPCYPCNLPKQPSLPLETSLDEFNEVKIGDTAEGPSGVCPCCLQRQKQDYPKYTTTYKARRRVRDLSSTSSTTPVEKPPRPVDNL